MGSIIEVLNMLPAAVDVYELLSKLRIKVIVTDHSSKDGYAYMGNIILNQRLEDNYRQFVLAHELGHVMLHHSQALYGFSSNTLYDPEYEANLFACLLLKQMGLESCIPNEMIDKVK